LSLNDVKLGSSFEVVTVFSVSGPFLVFVLVATSDLLLLLGSIVSNN